MSASRSASLSRATGIARIRPRPCRICARIRASAQFFPGLGPSRSSGSWQLPHARLSTARPRATAWGLATAGRVVAGVALGVALGVAAGVVAGAAAGSVAAGSVVAGVGAVAVVAAGAVSAVGLVAGGAVVGAVSVVAVGAAAVSPLVVAAGGVAVAGVWVEEDPQPAARARSEA